MSEEKSPKKLNQKQLVQIFKDIKRLGSQDMRFCFLVGAGASKSSGIPTGGELAEIWYNDLRKLDVLNSQEIEGWEKLIGSELKSGNAGSFYQFLYEKRYGPSPQIGYDEFQKLMENNEPSIGYVILSQILTQEKHNFVITTNFDYLIEDAIRMYTPKKPFTAGHETLAEFISSQTDRPTIIKVHRDLFLHPFNSNNDTNKLKDEWKRALTPILNHFHLLVLGYGGNDGSLMDYLKEIPRKSIYWCVKNENSICAKVKNLLTENDYIVQIEGFDELMYTLYNELQYDIFSHLDDPDQHAFIQLAKNRITGLYDHFQQLAETYKNNNTSIPKDLKTIVKGASKILLEAYSEQNNEKKESILKNGLTKYPDDPHLNESYASLLFDNGKINLAEEHYKRAVSIKPDFHIAFFNWGVDLRNLAKKGEKKEFEDRLKHAIEKVQTAVEIKPDFHEAYLVWCNCLMDLADLQKGKKSEILITQAIKKLKRVIEIKPDSYSAYCIWGNCIVNLANLSETEEKETLFELAITKYEQSCDINSNSFETYNNWGNCLGEFAKFKGDTGAVESDEIFNNAFVKYQKAMEINPNSLIIYDNWGTDLMSFAGMKEGEVAKELYKSAIEIFQKALHLGGEKYNLACANAIINNEVEAFKYLKQSLSDAEVTSEYVLKDSDWDAYKSDLKFLQLLENYNE